MKAWILWLVFAPFLLFAFGFLVLGAALTAFFRWWERVRWHG